MGTCCTQNISAVDINMLRVRTRSYPLSAATPQCPGHPSSLSIDLCLSPVHCAADSGVIDLKIRDSKIVCGYIRRYIEPSIAQYIIPSVVISLCASYYFWPFGFEMFETLCDRPAVVEITGPSSETVRTLSTRTLPVLPSTPSPGGCLHCAFGHHWIHSLSGKQVTYRIKMNAFDDRSRVLIGFCSTDRLTRTALDQLIGHNPNDGDHDEAESDSDCIRGLHLVDGDGKGYSYDSVRGTLAPLQEG